MIQPKIKPREILQEEKLFQYLFDQLFPSLEKEIKLYDSLIKDSSNQKVSYPRNSWLQIYLPLQSSQKVRDKIQLFNTPNIRIGKLFEIIDILSGLIAYKYCYFNTQEAVIVTACFDDVDIAKPISAFHDLFIQGYSSYVGQSTIEIQIEVYQQECLMSRAKVLMVSRQKNNYSKKFILPLYSFEGEEDKQFFEELQTQGKINQEQRIKNGQESLQKKAPSQQEIEIIHEFFINKEKYLSDKSFINMESTKFEKTLIMHKQDRNPYDKIFGGHMLREALELGALSAALLSDNQFSQVNYLGDCQFIHPVDIGNVLKFESRIGYNEGNLVQVNVTCLKLEQQDKKVKVLDLQITFQITESKNKRKVYPITYEDSMIFIESKRMFMNKVLKRQNKVL